MTQRRLWLVCSGLLWVSACLQHPDTIGVLLDDEPEASQMTSDEDGSTEDPSTAGEPDPDTADPPDPDPGTEGEEPPQPCAGDCPCGSGEVCEQYCDPASEDCMFSCAPGSLCFQECGPGTPLPCTSDCEGADACVLQCVETGGCLMSCVATGICTVDCSGGCESMCVGSSCEMFCPEGGCLLHCIEGQSCRMMGCPFGCTVICEGVEDCSSDCDDPSCTVIES